LLSDGSGNSAKGTTITINKCCNLTYSYSESYLELFGVVISSTINFSICLCCCNDFWGLGTASLFGAGWFGGTVLTGAVAALLLEILSGIAALLAIIEFGCYLAEGMPDKTCVGYTGLLVIVGGRRIGEPVFVGTAYCPC
jgi:hypothetical protein